MFRKPTLADIYVSQIKSQLDDSVVPVYSPATPDIGVGTIGRFVDGAFERRGHLDELLGGTGSFAAQVPIGAPSEPATFWFSSDNTVRLEPTGTVSALGKELLKARLSFGGKRAVVASFTGLVERGVASARSFDDLLWKLYYKEDLRHDEVVVYLHRGAASGTVLVNRKGNVDVELTVDASLLPGGLSFEGLGMGVQFGAGSQASAQITGTALTFAVMAKGLSGDEVGRVQDVRNFDAGPDESLQELLGNDVPSITPDDILGDADFDQPEE